MPFTNGPFCRKWTVISDWTVQKFIGLYKYYFWAWPWRKYKVVITKSPGAFSKYTFAIFPNSQNFRNFSLFSLLAQIFENWFDLSGNFDKEILWLKFFFRICTFLSFKKFLQFCFGILWFLRYLQTGQTQKLDQIIYIWLLDSTLISRLIFGKQKLAFHFLEIKFLKNEKYPKFRSWDTSYHRHFIFRYFISKEIVYFRIQDRPLS